MKKLMRCFLTAMLLVGLVAGVAFPQSSDVKTPNDDLIVLETRWCNIGDSGCYTPTLFVRLKNLNSQTAYSVVIAIQYLTPVGYTAIEQIGDLYSGEDRWIEFSLPTDVYGRSRVSGYKSITARAMWQSR